MLPKIKTILYATGLGPGSPVVFRYALALAKQHDATIVAVHGVEPLPPFAQSLVELHVSHQTSAAIHEQTREAVKARLLERIQRLCALEYDLLPDCRDLCRAVRIGEGQPAQVILDLAAEVGADLIVMGSHRHTVLGNAMLGSTTHKVLHSATQPVLVVRIPEGYREEGF